ncbi:hypothetical protein ACEWY4_025159 [Coilia grayii]|uniref:MSP domain-containing protein n=1 Tax=Coilia grayii TaxID=363190 RepID=A0ABD1IWT2_9TELE
MRRSEQELERWEKRDAPGPSSPPVGPAEILPVFVFPTELVFYEGQRSTHKRVLTFYNPYNFPLRFKMLCTAPALYTVVEAEGSVRPRSCVDIVVRHQDVSSMHLGRRDRFRLKVWGAGRGGCREVWAELREGQEPPQDKGGVRPVPPPPQPARAVLSPELYRPQRGAGNLSQFIMYVVIGLVCVAVLMLPLQHEHSQLVPTHAHVTVMQKLVCAYVLGESVWTCYYSLISLTMIK